MAPPPTPGIHHGTYTFPGDRKRRPSGRERLPDNARETPTDDDSTEF